ncbi:unnamed protein product, partial [Brassica rapa]
MGLISNKITREKLQPGDHIYTWRIARAYAHHGIYVGDGKVVHYTHIGGPQSGIPVSLTPKHRMCLICKDHSSFKGGKVLISCLDCFLAGGKLYLFKYNVSKTAFLAKPRGGTSTLAPSDPPEDVLVRANFHLHIDGWFGDYDLRENNCEDFAIYCKTGLLVCKKNSFGTSGQVNAAAAASLALVVHACGLSMLGVGVYCYARVKNDVSRNDDVVKVPAKELVSILESDRTSAREVWLSIAGSKFMG